VACYDAGYYVSGSTWKDLSGNGRHLSLYSATQQATWATLSPWTPAVTTVTPSTGSGVFFSGPSSGGTGQAATFANLAAGFSLLGTGNSFTFMAWIYPTLLNGPPYVWTLNRFGGTDVGTVNQAVMQIPCFSDVSSNLQGFGGLPQVGTDACSSAGVVSPPVNTWSHVAFVRNGITGSYYLNGVLNGTVTAYQSNSVTYGTSNFTVGCDYRQIIYGTTNPRCYNGYIASMAFLNTSLAGADVSLAYAGTGPNAAPSGSSRYVAPAGRRRRLMQAAPTCLSATLRDSSGATIAAASGLGSAAVNATYASLPPGNYTLVPALLNGAGQAVGAPGTPLPVALLAAPPPAPPPPLAGAVWVVLELAVPAASYDDTTAERALAAAALAVSAAVLPAGGTSATAALLNVSVSVDLDLAATAGRRLRAASAVDLTAVAAAVAASPAVAALLAAGGASGPVTAVELPGGAAGTALRIELGGVAGSTAAAVAAAAAALAPGPSWLAALPSGTTATAAPGGPAARLLLSLLSGVTVSATRASVRAALAALDVVVAAVAAAEGQALGAALGALGATAPPAAREVCISPPAGLQLCAWALPGLTALLAGQLLSDAAAAPAGATNALDLTAVAGLGALLNGWQSGAAANATEVNSLRLQLLQATADMVGNGSPAAQAASASDAVAAAAAVLNVSVAAAAYQGDAATQALPSPVVAAGLSLLAALASASSATSAATAAELANVTAALLGAPGGAAALQRTAVDDAVVVLAAVAAAPFPLAPGAAQAVVTGLSLVATSPGAAQPRAGEAPSAFAALGAAAGTLAAGVAATAAPACAAAVAAGDQAGATRLALAAGAPAVGLVVSCHAAGAADDPLYSTGLSVPGGLASLGPLPAATPLGGSGAAVTATLLALAFDAHGGAGGGAGTAGVTLRLEFTDAATGAPVVLAGLASPLLLDVATPPGGSGTVLFWDPAAGAYSSAGVVTQPNPAPRGALLTWRPAFTASSADDLPLAWAMQLPGCAEQLLNCSDAWERTLAVSLDPQARVGDPVVACGADVAHGLRRAFVGHSCALWRPGGGVAGCGWNVSAQAFQGVGCVVDPVTRAATLHTTDFYAGPAPRVALPPLAALAPPSADELARTAPLLALLLGLFVAMHVLAALLAARDRRDMARATARCCSPRLGCSVTAGGLRVWRLTQAPLGGAVAALRGSAVEFAALLGVPYARLALALPAHLFGGQQLRHATGRAGGISGAALRQHHALLMRAATRGLRDESPEVQHQPHFPRGVTLAAQHRVALATEAPQLDLLDYVSDADALLSPPDALQLSSTALVHAYQATWCLVGAEELAQQQARYIAQLAAHGVDPGGARFLRLFGVYKELLMGPLFSAGPWAARARLFRVVLTWHDADGWEPTGALAVALQAAAAPAAAARQRGLQRVRHAAQALVSAALTAGAKDGGANAAALDDTAGALYDQRRRLGVHSAPSDYGKQKQKYWNGRRFKLGTPMGDEDDVAGSAACADDDDDDDGGGAAWADDPLHFSGAALRASTPPALRRAFSGDAAGAERAWATALAVAWLDAQDNGWLVTAPLAPGAPRTLADAGAAQLAAQLASRGAAPLLVATSAAAAHQLEAWEHAADARVTAARAAHVSAPFYALSQAQRVACALLNALLAQCATVAMVASLYSVGTRRYMSALALGTGLLAALLVDVGLFYSKGAVCCGDARVALGCSRDDATACRGFSGSCAQLADVHVPFAAAALAQPPQPRPLLTPPCVAFPADGSVRDTFLAGVLVAAVSLPVTAGVAVLFSLAVATDAAQPRAAVRLLTWPLRARLLMGRPRWRLAAMPPAAARRRAALGRWWATAWATDVIVACADAVRAWPPIPPPGAAPDPAAGAALDAAEVRIRRAAFALLYAVWAGFAYFVVVYGRLVLRLRGPDGDAQFARAWLAALGAGQAAELRAFVLTAAEALAVATLLDALWLVPNNTWLEAQLDYASVQAAAFRRGRDAARVTAARRAWAYLQHFKAVR
jgi:hypothetical protein